MSKVFAAFFIALVLALSASPGSGFPEGWLWTRISPVACLSRALFTICLGSATVAPIPPSLAVLAALSFQAAGQNTSSVDSTLVGRSIFNLLPSREKGNKATVTVRQSPEIKEAFNRQVAANASKRVVVYRIRIYNDNKQNARSASESAMNRFKAMYPGVAAYRSYVNPFFKVTVGNFHSRALAM